MRFAQENPKLLSVVGVISNKKDAPALEKAKRFDVPVAHIPHREQKEQIEQLREWGAEWACLAGYMRIVRPEFLQFFYDSDRGYARVLNIHPSLLPAFPGLDAYGQAFAAGVAESGVTVHLVDEEMDHGPVLLQRSFPRNAEDDLEAFTNRGRAIENDLYVEALAGLLRGEVQPKEQEKSTK